MNKLNIDTDILNYNYEELLSIFKLTNLKTTDHAQLNKKLLNIKEKFSEEIYSFYFKAYKILLCIFQMNLESTNINSVVNKIKKVRSFEAFETNELITLLKVYDSSNKNNDLDNDQDHLKINQKQTNYNRSIVNISDIPKFAGGPVLNSFNYDVAPGQLNSIKRNIHIQNLNLNSFFRKNYSNTTSTDFQYLIPTEIKNVASIRLSSIEIPNYWYLISQKNNNNTFKITIISTEYLITIPDGNYSANALILFLNTTYFYQSTTTNDLKYIEFSINPNNQKSQFNLKNAPSGLRFSLQFRNDDIQNVKQITSTFGWILGYRLPIYLNINSKIQSEGLYNDGKSRYIYVSLNDFQYNHNILNIVGLENSIIEDDIIAKVPITNGTYSIIIDDTINPLTKTRTYNGPVNIRNLHIKLLDMYGDLIDLNYMDYSLTIKLDILYECFSFNDVTA